MKMKRVRLLVVAAATSALLGLNGCGQGGAGLPAAGRAGQPGGSNRPVAQDQGGGKPARSRQGNSQTAAQGQSTTGGQAAGRRGGPIPVQAVTVEVGALSAENTTAGAVVPVLQSQVAAQVAGVVARVLRNSGDWVKTGEAVVQLDDAQLTLAVRNAEAALRNAQISYEVGRDTVSQSNPKLQLQVQAAQSTLAAARKNYDAQKALFDLGGTSASALDSAASQLQQAQANLQAAQTALEQNQNSGSQSLTQLELAVDQAGNQLQAARINLANATVRAPFDGQIAAINVNPGGFVSQNTSVFLLVSSERQVSFSVPPTDAASLPAGAAVRFTYAGRYFPLHVSQAPSAPINGVVPMVALVPPASTLAYGAVGTVSYEVHLADGALIPIAALGTSENHTFVYSIAGDKAAVRQVTILGETGVTAAVAGIQAGTSVIVNPPPGLLEGAAVQAVAP